MKKSMFTLFILSIGIVSQAGAVMQSQSTYNSFEEFQVSGDAPICKVVTDGCNEWSFADGQKGDPIKACKLTADFEYTWSCGEYNDDIMFLQSEVQEDMMYVDPLTPQERKNYTTFLEVLSEDQFEKVALVTLKYMEKYSQYSEKQQIVFAKKVQTLIQKHIDTQKDNSQIVGMLEFLKLELKLVVQNRPIGSIVPTSGDVYTCQGAEYRVYTEDYIIDDMAFVLEKNEIHVSDGSFLLPNFIANMTVSASGSKYIGKNTETQEAYTFWMKADELTVYKADTLIDTCKKK